MKNLNSPIFLMLLFCLLFAGSTGVSLAADEEAKSEEPAAAPEPAGPVVLDRIIAAVDGEPFTSGDLRRFMAAHGQTAPKVITAADPDVQKYLREMILARLLEKEAEKAGISVSDEEIEAYIAEIRSQNQVDSGGFESLLQERGLSSSAYRQQVKAEIIKTRIIGSNVRTKINIVDEDIDAYLKTHPEYLPKEGEIHLEQIFIPAQDGTEEAELKKLRKKAVAGAEFSELSQSHYTDLGFMQLGDLKESLREGLSDEPQTGEFSKVVSTFEGSYLLHVVAAEGNSEVIGDSLKKQIRQAIYQEKFQKVMDDFLTKELPSKYTVETKL